MNHTGKWKSIRVAVRKIHLITNELCCREVITHHTTETITSQHRNKVKYTIHTSNTTELRNDIPYIPSHQLIILNKLGEKTKSAIKRCCHVHLRNLIPWSSYFLTFYVICNSTQGLKYDNLRRLILELKWKTVRPPSLFLDLLWIFSWISIKKFLHNRDPNQWNK